MTLVTDLMLAMAVLMAIKTMSLTMEKMMELEFLMIGFLMKNLLMMTSLEDRTVKNL